MATPNSTDFEENGRKPRKREMTLGEFIRTKRMPNRRKKTSLGIKKLLDKFESKLVTGVQVPGSVHATPSAPSPESDSDCGSWGSDFDDEDSEENSSWDMQEEVENDINTMLEAAMERTKNLENSRFSSNETTQQLSSRSDALASSENLDLAEAPPLPPRPEGPPLPPRNPGLASGTCPVNRVQGSGISATSATPSRDVSNISQNILLGSTSGAPMKPLWKKHLTPTPTAAISSSSDTVTAPLPSDNEKFGVKKVGGINVEPQIPCTSTQTSLKFPPDVISTAGSPSPLPLSSSAIAEAIATASARRKVRTTGADKDTSGTKNGPASHVLSPATTKQPHPNISKGNPAQSQESTAAAVPPPLPSRPPPIARYPISNPGPKNKPTRTIGAASVTESKVDSGFKNLSHLSSVGLSEQTGFTEISLKKSPVTKSELTSTRPDSSEHQQKPITFSAPKTSKIKPITFSVPKILKDLDAAVLQQVMPKKSYSFSETQVSVSKFTSCPEGDGNAEADIHNPTEEYLNPKEAATETMDFAPDRPTLPQRLKQSRSLPLILVENFRRDQSKNKVSTDEKDQQKLHLQSSQAIKETPEDSPQLASVDDEVFRQPWYHPVTWAQAQFNLTAMAQDGAFLVRPSSKVSQGIPYTVSVFFRGRIINCHISCTPDKKYILGKMKPNQKTFDTVIELIRYYQSTPAELKISEVEPISKVCLLITPPKDNDKIYAEM